MFSCIIIIRLSEIEHNTYITSTLNFRCKLFRYSNVIFKIAIAVIATHNTCNGMRVNALNIHVIDT